MSDLPNWSLTANSQSLQAAALKTLSSHSWQNKNHIPACVSAAAFGFRLTCMHSKEAGFFLFRVRKRLNMRQYRDVLLSNIVKTP